MTPNRVCYHAILGYVMLRKVKSALQGLKIGEKLLWKYEKNATSLSTYDPIQIT